MSLSMRNPTTPHDSVADKQVYGSQNTEFSQQEWLQNLSDEDSSSYTPTYAQMAAQFSKRTSSQPIFKNLLLSNSEDLNVSNFLDSNSTLSEWNKTSQTRFPATFSITLHNTLKLLSKASKAKCMTNSPYLATNSTIF
ncbi:predicted protein [Scheffersomyces stipitis CBS 6054]|uniref:Uncharacterized protein n=1 Tax=Scheffersomyces stipitis (strain ATCC 58785 / CBS 6054 / NBRC 10063 / NRRL Y-11545) TaxID=322104 RepID=A3LN70_PICST|nr:predicted protein [Scheffersomyces stipitis CBS 6054]ABN64280.2 predicted protein [Scheffersomyces stipitis CBS 6054]KAG2737017.1 hypothetical protein G9P44_001107 [Scheffersomyces stipitis]